MKKVSSTDFKDLFKKIVLIILGTFILAVAINLFIIPNKLLSGGLSGIGLMLQYIFNLPMGITLLIFNIPLLILSILKINKKFTAFTILGTISLSVCLMLTSSLNNVLAPVEESYRLLYCIYGGILSGIGTGIVFSNEGSTGGMDILAIYAKKKYDIEIGIMSFTINFLIVAVGSVLFNFKVGLYTLISMYITVAVMEKVMNGLNRRKMLLIVSEKEKEVSDAIMSNFNRGVTILYGEGAYTKHRKNIVYCVVSLGQLPQIKRVIKVIDQEAFISIIDIAEVEGNGFKSPIG
ncbi:YitT family protein [Clostridium sp. CM028]|uniref:YitT family protein n=1 Tax=Clostridium TaxID=1485 RepID=UPI0013EEDCBA|nr:MULTISPECIES: YitT family protein [Clostridium]MBW9147353.1 YitT family protein [Clostridium sp. CM027]MBW9150626.1 YitT family protein [Clostridium sp. CM028]MBZ9609836.1 YitT family protein [Clostridium estertheticum]UVE39956.1 YitT family protein [Clostridium sp. CM027]WLC60645.1 YitT family protein [Clostridium sp. CM028]